MRRSVGQGSPAPVWLQEALLGDTKLRLCAPQQAFQSKSCPQGYWPKASLFTTYGIFVMSPP